MNASLGRPASVMPVPGDHALPESGDENVEAAVVAGVAGGDMSGANFPELPDMPEQSRSRLFWALKDIGEGLRLWRLAVSLGWLDIRLQFRGSRVGPLWLTLGTAVMIGSMGVLYSRLFHIVLKDYLPYLSISMILWQIGIAGVTQEACNCFISAASSIRATRLPFSLQALRVLVRNSVVFGYNIIVPVAVYSIFGLLPGPVAFPAIPGLAIRAMNAFAFCLPFGSVAARHRYIPPIFACVGHGAF